MNELEVAQVVEILEEFHAAAEYLAAGDSFDGSDFRRANRVVSECRPLVRLIAERLLPEVVGLVDAPFDEARDAAAALIGVLKRRTAIEGLLPAKGPALLAANLHERVRVVALPRWAAGHRLDAIRAAAVEVEQQLRSKLNVYDKDVTQLVGEAFGRSQEELAGRLRFRHILPDSNDWRNVHEGAAQFGRGVFMAIRNPHAHNNAEPSEAVAFEHLAALSLLARWIDESEVTS